MQIKEQCETTKKPLSKNQKEWVEFFNTKGIKMISVPNIYTIAGEGDKKVISELQKAIREHVLITSTRMIYSKKTLETQITHDADSTSVEPKSFNLPVPVLSGSVKNNPENEKFLQTLFLTNDSFEQMIDKMKVFYEDKEFRVWTPDQSSRASRPIRSVDLGSYVFRFYLGCGGWFFDYAGVSFGVNIDSAPKEQGKVKEVSK